MKSCIDFFIVFNSIGLPHLVMWYHIIHCQVNFRKGFGEVDLNAAMHLSFWHLFIFSKKVCIITKKLIYIFLGKIFKKCHKLTLCLTVLRIVTELLEVARTFPGQILFLTVTVATTHSTCMCNRISWRFFWNTTSYNSRFEHSFGRLESYKSILDQFWRYSKRIHPI